MEDWVEREKKTGRLGMATRFEDETDVEFKKDKQEMKRETVRWMNGCMMAKQKRQMERSREGYIAVRLNVQHMARVRDRK